MTTPSEKEFQEAAKAVMLKHQCDCETCAHSAAICPAMASSLVLEIVDWEKTYRTLAIRANQLEHLVGEIAMLLRKDMTEAVAP